MLPENLCKISLLPTNLHQTMSVPLVCRSETPEKSSDGVRRPLFGPLSPSSFFFLVRTGDNDPYAWSEQKIVDHHHLWPPPVSKMCVKVKMLLLRLDHIISNLERERDPWMVVKRASPPFASLSFFAARWILISLNVFYDWFFFFVGR